MKRSVILVLLCMVLVISKYVVSGAYYDYVLQRRQLVQLQMQLIDDNKRAIAELENFRSANYLFSQKEYLNLKELTSANTILLKDNHYELTEDLSTTQ